MVLLLHLNIVYEVSEYMDFTQSFSVLKLSVFILNTNLYLLLTVSVYVNVWPVILFLWDLSSSRFLFQIICNLHLVNQFSLKISLVHIFIPCNTRYIYFGKTNCYWKLWQFKSGYFSCGLFFISLKRFDLFTWLF